MRNVTEPMIDERRPGWGRSLVTWWAVLGVVAILLRAAASLGERGIATMRSGLGPWELAVLLVATVGFVYGEGVWGLQRGWVPHVIGRIRRLREAPRPVYAVLAPLYAMSLVGPPWKRLLRGWIGVVAIVAAVLLVRSFPEPWRGIVDVAVAAALVWGAAALALQARRAFARGPA